MPVQAASEWRFIITKVTVVDCHPAAVVPSSTVPVPYSAAVHSTSGAVICGNGGNGGDGGGSNEGYANYGGNWSRSNAISYDPDSALIEFVTGDLWEHWVWDLGFYYATIYDVNMTSYFGDYRWYSGYGGGAFCDIGSNVTFINCEIRGNRTYGGMSGIGGEIAGTSRNLEPVLAYEIPTYGAGIYCAADSV
ncbi:unnamed protein product, partial [marine sediment metagenome]